MKKTCYEVEVIQDDLWFSMILTIINGKDSWQSPKIPLGSLTRAEANSEAAIKGKALADSLGGIYKNGNDPNQVASAPARGEESNRGAS